MFYFIFIIALVVNTPFGSCDGPDTVQKLDLEKYSGLWYQVLYNQYVSKSQQQNQMCVVAKYTFVDNSTFSSVQYSRLEGPFGPEMKTQSKLVRPNLKNPGSFQVLVSGAPFPTPYLVIKLGEVNKNTGLYEYSIVTDLNGVSLIVFTRDLRRFRHVYEDDVIDFCNKMGFSSYYNQPVESPQPRSCKYYSEDNRSSDDEDNLPKVIYH